MKPDKLEQNYEKLQLKEQSREQRKQARLNQLVNRYAGVSSEALVSRSDEARARASIFLTAFIISLSTCLISGTGLAFSGLLEQVMATTLPLLTAALSIVTSISTPVAVLTFFFAAKLYKEIDQVDDVLEWRFKRGCRDELTMKIESPKYEPIWDYDTPEEYFAAGASRERLRYGEN